jgi:hypothetical protein
METCQFKEEVWWALEYVGLMLETLVIIPITSDEFSSNIWMEEIDQVIVNRMEIYYVPLLPTL